MSTQSSRGGPETTLSSKIHSAPFDRANLRTNKKRASIAIFPRWRKHVAGPFEADASELTGKYLEISMIDLMGKKVKSSFTPAKDSSGLYTRRGFATSN